MKIFIASDIHGSAYWAEKMLDAYKKEGAQRLILLGDILYHGPRNDLPRDYAPKKVIEMLNPLRDEILAVRGNCDTEVDQMVLDFPLLADYALLFIDGVKIFATHGHRFSEENPPPLKAGDILLAGHTHISKIAEKGSFTYVNPGSVSIPKENTKNGYAILEKGKITLKTL